MNIKKAETIKMRPFKIMVIDDESIICNACRSILSDHGYEVDTCQSGQKGLKLLLENEYDLALVDMKLPDIHGMEILQTLKSKKSDVYVIIMTGYSSVKNAVQAMKIGAFDYLSKPFTDDELLLAAAKSMESKQLKEENLSLRRQHNDRFNFSNIIGKNDKILKIYEKIQRVATTNSTVLLCGESGVGKELFARAIHDNSKRADNQFVAIDCSTFSSSLLESELFGHVKGAFTGAVMDKTGIFEVANHGSLFLDEVANLEMGIQAKLLRVMETHEFKPVGASLLKKTDFRIISATNQNLKTMIDKGNFREDFFYRLNVFPIFIPPLRDRKDDIPRLLYHFLKVYCRQIEKRVDGFSDDALEMLIKYDWPGNVRQLKNVVERLVIMADDRILHYRNLSDHWDTHRDRDRDTIPETLKELKSVKQRLVEDQFGQVEKAFLQKALSAAKGNITQAAKKVDMQRSNFSALMKKHNLPANIAKTNSEPV